MQHKRAGKVLIMSAILAILTVVPVGDKVVQVRGLRIVDSTGRARIVAGVSELAGDEGPYFAMVDERGEPYIRLSAQGDDATVTLERGGRKLWIAVRDNDIEMRVEGRGREAENVATDEEAVADASEPKGTPTASFQLFCSDTCSFLRLRDSEARAMLLGQDPIGLFLDDPKFADFGVILTDEDTGQVVDRLIFK